MHLPYRVGIVGCGRIAGGMDRPQSQGFVGTHAQAYRRNPQFILEAAVNPTAAPLRAFQETWGIPRGYEALEEMLAQCKLDAISLCTPTELHAEQLLQMLQSPNCPRVVFAEKPVCLTRVEMSQLVAASRGKECVIVVNHSRRFDPGHHRLMSYVQAGELGGLLQGRCDYYGGWLNNGCHVVDTLLMLFGRAVSVERAQPGPPGKKDDPCLNVRLRVGQAPIDVAGFDEGYYQLYESEFRFERGRVVIADFGSTLQVERVTVNDIGERVLAAVEGAPWRGLDSPLYHAVSAIAKYLDGGRKLAGQGVLLEEAASTMNVLWTAMERLQRGEEN